MVSIVKVLKNWNIRGAILFSLVLQVCLIFFASLRKRTRGFTHKLIWVAYLLADATANYCIGLISKTESCKSSIAHNDSLMAFWGPFLLLHLGGPDTITALSLEDNELWRRHLLGLGAQAVAAAYVFFLTVPGNTLWLPTVLVFVAGVIKYGERIIALYLASIDTFRRSMVSDPDPGPNYAKLVEEHSYRLQAGLPAEIITVPELDYSDLGNYNGTDTENHVGRSINEEVNVDVENVRVEVEEVNDVEEVQRAYKFFGKFKGLIVGMIFSFGDRSESRKYFANAKAEKIFRVIEIELNFMYENFYTKATLVRHLVGILCRFISFSSVVLALVLFVSVEKKGFDMLDVRVTYALLYGALALDLVAFFMLIFADRTAAAYGSSHETQKDSDAAASGLQRFKCFLVRKILKYYLKKRRPSWKPCKDELYKGYMELSTPFLYRRSCGSISGYNLLAYCLDLSTPKVPNIDPHGFRIAKFIQRKCFRIVLSVKATIYDLAGKTIGKYFGIRDMLADWFFKEDHPFLLELWELIFIELERKSSAVEDNLDVENLHRISSSRGEWVLHEVDLKSDNRKKLMPFVDPNEVAYDQSILLWHIATHLCYYDVPDATPSAGGEQNGDGHHGGDEQNGEGPHGGGGEQNGDGHHGGGEQNGEGPHSGGERNGDGHHSGGEQNGEGPHGGGEQNGDGQQREISMLLSDYMLYLLIMQPTMMSAVAGIGQRRFQDTCAEAMKFFSKRSLKERNQEEKQKRACKILLQVPTEIKPTEIKGDRSKSLLFDACRLAKELKELKDEKWKIISQVWVELLSYAASHCIPTTFVQELSKGGELISFVWLLLTQLGLGMHFQIKEGEARAELIVGKLANPPT